MFLYPTGTRVHRKVPFGISARRWRGMDKVQKSSGSWGRCSEDVDLYILLLWGICNLWYYELKLLGIWFSSRNLELEMAKCPVGFWSEKVKIALGFLGVSCCWRWLSMFSLIGGIEECLLSLRLTIRETVWVKHMFPSGILKHGHQILKQELITEESPTSLVRKKAKTYIPCRVIQQH